MDKIVNFGHRYLLDQFETNCERTDSKLKMDQQGRCESFVFSIPELNDHSDPPRNRFLLQISSRKHDLPYSVDSLYDSIDNHHQ
jgi:hypothetical protein